MMLRFVAVVCRVRMGELETKELRANNSFFFFFRIVVMFIF